MKEKIIELRKKGLTINEIVKEVGCAKSTVSYHINSNGLGGNSKNILINQIKDLRLSGKTYNEIALLVNVTKDGLKKICRTLRLNKSKNVKHNFNKDEVLEIYYKFKSIRLTAKHFNVSREMIRKFIDDDKIIRETIKITNKEAVINWRRNKKISLIEYKGGSCEKCGYNKSVNAMHFHHLNSDEKDFTISGKSYSFERLKKEVDKCILVCANCHAEIHDSLNIM